jgi:hypothetical protein
MPALFSASDFNERDSFRLPQGRDELSLPKPLLGKERMIPLSGAILDVQKLLYSRAVRSPIVIDGEAPKICR